MRTERQHAPPLAPGLIAPKTCRKRRKSQAVLEASGRRSCPTRAQDAQLMPQAVSGSRRAVIPGWTLENVGANDLPFIPVGPRLHDRRSSCRRSPLVLLAGLISLLAVVAVPAALADQVFHTSHAAVHAVAGAPLQSGFVNDIHTNGTVNAAREEYHLNGAQPNTTYQVQLVIYGDQSCAGSPFADGSDRDVDDKRRRKRQRVYDLPGRPAEQPAPGGRDRLAVHSQTALRYTRPIACR